MITSTDFQRESPAWEPIAFVDLETTGANFANDRIIEVGIVQLDRDGMREWNALVNPETAISSFITGLTGIDDTMVADAPTFAQLAPEVLALLRGRLFVAHNARFDYGFLKREFNRAGIVFHAPTLCTVKLSRKLFPGHHRHNLDTLIERHGLQASSRHRALADARILNDLWHCWRELFSFEQLRGAVDAIVGRHVLPPQLDPACVDNLPEAPGAAAYLAEDGELLLIERAANLRQQVLGHFSPSHRDTSLARRTSRIEWRETAGEFGARLQEILLARALTLRQGPDTPAPCAWKIELHGVDAHAVDGEGDFRPRLVQADEVDFGANDDLFGLYANRREAVHALRKLADAHRLCHTRLGLGEAIAGQPCVGYRQKTCRGACIGKESSLQHGARLMAALAKFRLKGWPHAGPLALVERDAFGMHEDVHLFDRWRYLGTAHDQAGIDTLLSAPPCPGFDAEIYRLASRFVQAGKVRIVDPAEPGKLFGG